MEKTLPNKLYWGFWSTTGFLLLIFLVAVVYDLIILAVSLIVCSYPLLDMNAAHYIKSFSSDGLVFSISVCVNAVVSCGSIFLLVMLRNGRKLKEYIGFTAFRIKPIVMLFILFVAFYIFINYLSIRYRLFENQGFMENLFKSNVPYLFLCISLVLVAPFSEEVVFRGFFLQGILHSKLGKFGAVIIPSVLWAAIHTQYNYFTQGYLIVLGMFLGYLRIKSGSIWPAVLGHVFVNLIASVMATLYIYQ